MASARPRGSSRRSNVARDRARIPIPQARGWSPARSRSHAREYGPRVGQASSPWPNLPVRFRRRGSHPRTPANSNRTATGSPASRSRRAVVRSVPLVVDGWLRTVEIAFLVLVCPPCGVPPPLARDEWFLPVAGPPLRSGNKAGRSWPDSTSSGHRTFRSPEVSSPVALRLRGWSESPVPRCEYSHSLFATPKVLSKVHG